MHPDCSYPWHMPRHKELLARYPLRESFLKHFRRQGSTGVLFVETARPLNLSELVTVLVDFPGQEKAFRLQGRVTSRRRASRRPPLPPGVEVVLAPDQAHTLQLVLDHVAGKQVRFTPRRSGRVQVTCEISYRSNDAFAKEFSEDISEGGTFVLTERLLPVGTSLECRLKPPGYLVGVKVPARVAWLRSHGQPRGMGLEFVFASESQRRKLKKLLQRLRRRQGDTLERTRQRLRNR